MAAKKQNPVDSAVADIMKRYPGKATGTELAGVRSMMQYVQSFQDVVAESSLVDKYSSQTLDRAAAKVARMRYSAYGAGTEDARKARRGR